MAQTTSDDRARGPRPPDPYGPLLPVACVLVGLACAVAAPSPALADDACTASAPAGAGLGAARALFERSCPGLIRRDCDPVDGAWVCSSGVIGVTAPARADGGDEPAGSAPPAPAAPEPSPASVESSDACGAAGDDLNAARAEFAAACGAAPRDCDPVDGRWYCSADVIGDRAPRLVADVEDRGANGADDAPGVEPVPVSAPDPAPGPEPAPPGPDDHLDIRVESPPAEPAPVAASPPPASDGPSVGLLDGADLLVLMYDNCPDPDDGQAAAAGRSLVESFGIESVWVVNGTCGFDVRNRFDARSAALMDALWGDRWLDAQNEREATVAASVDAFASALSNDGDVWVAEGGPSDVTADVVRGIAERYPSLDLGRVHVVQHGLWNEQHTEPGKLARLRATVDYRRIPDGNVGGNGSADLNVMANEPRDRADTFARIARGGRFATEWEAAFAYLPPVCRPRTEYCKVDFSDTVELLYILGDDDTRTVLDFAGRYLR